MFRKITHSVVLEKLKRNNMSTIEMLTQKEKELVAVAASIASGCLPCTKHHIKAVREAGASEAEVLGAIGIASDVRDNATEIMAEAAQGNLNYEYPIRAQSSSIEQPIDHLVSLGAALACNSVAGLEHHLTAARAAGASTRQIQTAIGIAQNIRRSAAEKADSISDSLMTPARVFIAHHCGWNYACHQ
jgi:AhpD family alkylhydroperoxidase